MARGIEHILHQRSLYPLFPPGPDTLIDIGSLGLAHIESVSPDVIITPSELSPFARVVNSCIAVNPGRAARNQSNGTYAIIGVNSRGSNGIHEHTRVDITRL